MGQEQSIPRPIVEAYLANNLTPQSLTTLLQGHSSTSSPNSPDDIGPAGKAVMHLAAEAGDTLMLRLLLQNRASPTLPGGKAIYHRTPFHSALAAKQETAALMLWTEATITHGLIFQKDGLDKTPIVIAAQKHQVYMLWIMCVHVFCWMGSNAQTYNLQTSTWGPLSHKLFFDTMRRARAAADLSSALTPLLFVSKGLPGTLTISADRSDFDYHQLSTTTHKTPGLFPHIYNFSLLQSHILQPLISSQQPCLACQSAWCQTNSCVLTCFLKNFHSCISHLVSQYDPMHLSLGKNGVPGSPQLESQLSASQKAAIVNEIETFFLRTNPPPVDSIVSQQFQRQSFHHRILLPPPVLLTNAMIDSYVCTRHNCVCESPGVDATGAPIPKICSIYPPLLTFPSMPMEQLTPGYHRPSCPSAARCKQSQLASISSLFDEERSAVTNPHSNDILTLHEQYICSVERFFPHIGINSLSKVPSNKIFNRPSVDSPAMQIPGLSVPPNYVPQQLSKLLTPPKRNPPKSLSERANGLWGSVRRAVSDRSGLLLPDGSHVESLSDIENPLQQSLRYYAHRLVPDTTMTLTLVGQGRDMITPIRYTDAPVHNDLTKLYTPVANPLVPPNQLPPYDFEALMHNPVLSQSWGTSSLYGDSGAVAQNSMSVRSVTLNGATTPTAQHFRTDHPLCNPELSFDSSYSTAPVSHLHHEPAIANFAQTCLCGAHTTLRQPVTIPRVHISLTPDGECLRAVSSIQITDAVPELHEVSTYPYDNVISHLSPTTMMYYVSASSYHAPVLTSALDFGDIYLRRGFCEVVPAVNPTHDLSDISNNPGYFPPSNTTKSSSMAPKAAVTGQIQAKFSSNITTGAMIGPHPSTASRRHEARPDAYIVICPDSATSFRFKVPVLDSIFLYTSLQRVLQSRFPHFQLYHSWNAFIPRAITAIGRIAQYRLNVRLERTEIAFLHQFELDLSHLYGIVFLSNKQDDMHLKTTLQQYLALLQRYILLRAYRLRTSQFTTSSPHTYTAGIADIPGEDTSIFKLANNPEVEPAHGFSHAEPHPPTNSLPYSRRDLNEIEDVMEGRATTVMSGLFFPHCSPDMIPDIGLLVGPQGEGVIGTGSQSSLRPKTTSAATTVTSPRASSASLSSHMPSTSNSPAAEPPEPSSDAQLEQKRQSFLDTYSQQLDSLVDTYAAQHWADVQTFATKYRSIRQNPSGSLLDDLETYYHTKGYPAQGPICLHGPGLYDSFSPSAKKSPSLLDQNPPNVSVAPHGPFPSWTTAAQELQREQFIAPFDQLELVMLKCFSRLLPKLLLNFESQCDTLIAAMDHCISSNRRKLQPQTNYVTSRDILRNLCKQSIMLRVWLQYSDDTPAHMHSTAHLPMFGSIEHSPPSLQSFHLLYANDMQGPVQQQSVAQPPVNIVSADYFTTAKTTTSTMAAPSATIAPISLLPTHLTIDTSIASPSARTSSLSSPPQSSAQPAPIPSRPSRPSVSSPIISAPSFTTIAPSVASPPSTVTPSSAAPSAPLPVSTTTSEASASLATWQSSLNSSWNSLATSPFFKNSQPQQHPPATPAAATTTNVCGVALPTSLPPKSSAPQTPHIASSQPLKLPTYNMAISNEHYNLNDEPYNPTWEDVQWSYSPSASRSVDLVAGTAQPSVSSNHLTSDNFDIFAIMTDVAAQQTSSHQPQAEPPNDSDSSGSIHQRGTSFSAIEASPTSARARPSGNRRPRYANNQPTRTPRASLLDAQPYFFNMIKDDPNVLLGVLDDQNYIDMLIYNDAVIDFLQKEHPSILQRVYEKLPALPELVEQRKEYQRSLRQ